MSVIAVEGLAVNCVNALQPIVTDLGGQSGIHSCQYFDKYSGFIVFIQMRLKHLQNVSSWNTILAYENGMAYV